MEKNELDSKMDILEQNIKFIKDNHKDLTKLLIEEIDQLKHKKRELQFCLLEMIQDRNPAVKITRKYASVSKMDKAVMTDAFECHADYHLRTCSNTKVTSSIDAQKDEAARMREIRMLFLEQEAEENLLLVQKIKSENEKLRRLVKYKQPTLLQRMNMLEVVEESCPNTPAEVVPLDCEGLPFEVTLDPFLIHDHPPRPPQVAECKLILQQLAFLNRRQRHELNQLTSDLQDVLSAKTLDTDAFVLARKYIPKFNSCSPNTKNPLVINSQSIPKEKHPVVTNLIIPEFKNSVPLSNVAKYKQQICNKKQKDESTKKHFHKN